MKRLALLLLLLALGACEQPRTELMFGVVTDIKAPGLIDGARLIVTRQKDGFVEQDVPWELSGVPNQPFNLPGSYGVYSDGEEVKVDVVLLGLKGSDTVVTRRSVMNLIEGKTLFFRMSLTAGCKDRSDCLETESCVEGVCRDVNVNSHQLPDFEPSLVDHLTCDSGTAFIDTSTGAALPLAEGAENCPANLCIEGTCLKPPPTPSSGTRTVTGYQFTTYVEATKSTNVPAMPTGISAIVPNSDGTFTTIAGRGNPDGSFSIAAVPNGKYYLNVGNEYYVTDADNFDLTMARAGRPNAQVVSQPTTITLQNVTNLGAWMTGDQLEAVAPGADMWWFDLQMANPVTPGATALVNYSFTSQQGSSSLSQLQLINNDPFAVVQLQTKTSPLTGLVYQAASKIFQPAPFSQADGSTTTIPSGAFVDAPQTSMAQATLPVGLWDAMTGYDGTFLANLNPEAVHDAGYNAYGVFVHGQVGGAIYGQFSSTADYMFVAIPHTAGPNVPLSDVTFGTPTLLGTWATIVSADVSGTVPYTVPGTSTPVRLRVGIRQSALLSTLTPDFFTPKLGPVRAPTIDGLSLFAAQMQVSTTPTIAWQPPDIGKPTVYEVNVQELVAQGASTVSTQIATLVTTETTLVVPPNVLTLGHYYAVRITATNAPNAAAPHRLRFPDYSSIVASAMFVPTVMGGTGMGSGSGTPDGGVKPLSDGPIDATNPVCSPVNPQCNNCMDDDLDGKTDLQDPECLSVNDPDEATP